MQLMRSGWIPSYFWVVIYKAHLDSEFLKMISHILMLLAHFLQYISPCFFFLELVTFNQLQDVFNY